MFEVIESILFVCAFIVGLIIFEVAGCVFVYNFKGFFRKRREKKLRIETFIKNASR